MNPPALLRDFCEAAARKLDKDRYQIERCCGLLDDRQLWTRANAHCNSVGNLVLHLTGNVGQWILAGLAAEPFRRDRPAEFAERGPLQRSALLGPFNDVVTRATRVIRRLEPAALRREYVIQAYRVSGLLAVFHVAEHFSFHTGQIVQITKALRDVDLSLYDADGRPTWPGAAGRWPW